MLDHVFHTNIIAYCQQNRCVWVAKYTDLFTLITFLFLFLAYLFLYLITYYNSFHNLSISLIELKDTH